MAPINAAITRATIRSILMPPVLVLITIASASCGNAVGESSSPATPSYPRFVTVSVGAASEVDGVNDAGTVVGTAYIEGDTRGFIKVGNRVTEFDYPGTSDVTVMSGINDLGISIGHYSDDLGGNRGFARSADGRFTPIDDPNGGTAFNMGTTPMGINDAGIIVGTYIDNRDVVHGFVDNGGAFTTLNEPDAGTTGDLGTFVEGINNAGAIIGYYVDPRGYNYGFVDVSGTYTSFAAPGAGKGAGWGTRPEAIANDGLAAGYEVDALGANGWVRQGQTFYSLKDPNSTSGIIAGTRPAGVNEEGSEVVGKYTDRQGTIQGFIAYI